jgi:hypothetical protein
MSVSNEAELEQFLGNLVHSIGRAASGFIHSPIGQALGGVLKSVAKTALPAAGAALGSLVAPGIGTAIGGKLGSLAGSMLEVQEMEVMGQSEAELEAARRYVRWARGATRQAMRAPYGASPWPTAKWAAISAARQYAPAMLRTRPYWRSQGYAPYWRSNTGYGSGYTAGSGYGDGWGGAGYAPVADFGPPIAPMAPVAPVVTDPPMAPVTVDPGDSGASGELEAGQWVRRGSRIVLLGA